MVAFTLPTIPAALEWRGAPVRWEVEPGNRLTVVAGGSTDWFADPAGSPALDNAPCALFLAPDASFLLSARVSVEFASTFDAGVLQVRHGDDRWAKLCLEYSPRGQPMIVSVVTRGVSDDCNSAIIEGKEVYLRAAVTPGTLAFHYSRDGRLWHLVRYFSLGTMTGARVGFSAQSPTGQGCKATFSEIAYRAAELADNRSGE